MNADTRMPGLFRAPAAVVKTHGGIKKSDHAKAARGIAEKDGSLSRRVEQTGVAFDVILKMPTS